MYYHKVIVNFRKTAAGPLYQLHLLDDIPQDGTDLQTYAHNFTGNYIIAYGIIREMSDADSYKVYDFHTLYKPDVSTAMTMNVPLDMDGTRIINSPLIKRPTFFLPKYLKASDGKYLFLGGTNVIITPAARELVKLYFYTAELEFEHNLWFINSLNITTQHSRSYSYTAN